MSQSPKRFEEDEPDWCVPLDPDEPGIDKFTRDHRLALLEIKKKTPQELFEVAVAAGIYTPDGQLTEYYRAGLEPGADEPAAQRCPHCNGVVS